MRGDDGLGVGKWSCASSLTPPFFFFFFPFLSFSLFPFLSPAFSPFPTGGGTAGFSRAATADLRASAMDLKVAQPSRKFTSLPYPFCMNVLASSTHSRAATCSGANMLHALERGPRTPHF